MARRHAAPLIAALILAAITLALTPVADHTSGAPAALRAAPDSPMAGTAPTPRADNDGGTERSADPTPPGTAVIPRPGAGDGLSGGDSWPPDRSYRPQPPSG